MISDASPFLSTALYDIHISTSIYIYWMYLLSHSHICLKQ